MGYLVYCPTCSGRMSNNAESCPHCGETWFHEKIVERKKIECSACGGNGKFSVFLYSVPIYRESGNIYFPQEFVKTGEVKVDNSEMYNQDLSPHSVIIKDLGFYKEISDFTEARDAIKKRDYVIRPLDLMSGYAFYGNWRLCPYKFRNGLSRIATNMLFYKKGWKICEKCYGKGVVEKEIVKYKDIRRKVE